MITKETFLKIIELQRKADFFETKLSEIGIDAFNTPVYDAYDWYLDMLLEAYFTDEGKDWVSWWLFEKAPGLEAFNEDGSIINTDTVDELWELIKNYRK